jgi:hypothetical protein
MINLSLWKWSAGGPGLLADTGAFPHAVTEELPLMAEVIHDAPDDGPKGQPDWETVAAGVDRLPVPGGWIYRTDRGVVFVPDKAQDLSHMDTGAVG